MSAKSASNNEVHTSDPTGPDLPQVDNSDFDTNIEQGHVTTAEAELSLDRTSLFSLASSAGQEVASKASVSPEDEPAEEIGEKMQLENVPSTYEQASSTLTDKPEPVPTEESVSVKMDSSNSLYDSNEKLVFSRTTSDYSQISAQHGTFWRNLLLAIMLPYALVGVPVASLLSGQQHGASTAKQWLKFMFSGPVAIGLNSVQLLSLAMFNLYIAYLFLGPLYTLLGRGQMSERLIALSVNLYEIIPLLVGLNLVWPKGYAVNNLIRLLDDKSTFRQEETRSKMYRSLSKMATSYSCLMVLTIGSVVSFEWKSTYSYMSELRYDFYYHLATRFFLMLLIPVYLTIVSAVHQRVYELNRYVHSLSKDISSVSLVDLQRVKDVFKKNADLVCAVNGMFNLLLSDILIIVLINVLKDIFQVFMLLASLDSFSISLQKGSRQIDAELLSTATKWILIDLVVLLCKCMLIGLAVSKVKKTNGEIRQILSHLHDLASNYVEKPSEIYQSFSLVKYYIKTRNDRSNKPALLRIYAVKWIPCLSLR